MSPLPSFTEETAIQKIRAAEDAWNTRDPERLAGVYVGCSQWRNRSEIFQGRPNIVEFLTQWNRARLPAHQGRHTRAIVSRSGLAYEYHDDSGNWFRAYGNENWEFDEKGLMRQRHASINDLPVRESERKFHWDHSGPRPADHPASPISACDPGPRHSVPAPHPSGRAGRLGRGRAGRPAGRWRPRAVGVGLGLGCVWPAAWPCSPPRSWPSAARGRLGARGVSRRPPGGGGGRNRVPGHLSVPVPVHQTSSLARSASSTAPRRVNIG